MAQKEAVSGILVQGKKSFPQEVDKENAASCQTPLSKSSPCGHLQPHHSEQSSMFGSLFSGFTNCIETVSPQNFIVNVNSPSVSHQQSVDGVLEGIELEDLL